MIVKDINQKKPFLLIFLNDFDRLYNLIQKKKYIYFNLFLINLFYYINVDI